ncbi:MAG: flotillin-like FloA family protein [Planctomycetota bacterium]|jgi:uncharacterized protein YqfA (UPF0365 family)
MQTVIVVAAGLGLLLLCVFFVRWGSPWVQAKLNRLPVGLLRVMRMPSPSRAVQAAILAKKGGIEVEIDKIDAHLRAGSDPARVVLGLIAADEARVEVSFDELAAVNLKGGDVLAHVRTKAAV